MQIYKVNNFFCRLAKLRLNPRRSRLNLPNLRAPRRVLRFHQPPSLLPLPRDLLLESTTSLPTQNLLTTPTWTWCETPIITICSTIISVIGEASPRARRIWTGKMEWVWIVTHWRGCWNRCRVSKVRLRPQKWGGGDIIITIRIIHIVTWIIMAGILKRKHCIRILGRLWRRILDSQDQGRCLSLQFT